jgi:triacylglycerol lipase
VPTTYPIILAHGICPFDKLIQPFSDVDNRDDDRLHYFREIRSTLRQNGFLAFHSRVSWAADLERRASDLKKEITRVTEDFSRWERVHIIAHSMGGLDARHMIFRYQMQDRVASLTTIGTPHLGTAFADWGVKRFGILLDMVRPLGLNLEGFKDLTRKSCKKFNDITRDFEKKNGVLYQTIAGVQPVNRIFRPLRFSYRIIWREEGENDGLVSLKSATWSDEYLLERLDADHFDQIGWWDGSKAAWMDKEAFERRIRKFYLRISGGLKD